MTFEQLVFIVNTFNEQQTYLSFGNVPLRIYFQLNIKIALLNK
jgi:hypothetical protein